MERQLGLGSEYPSLNPGLSRHKLWNHTPVTSCYSFFHYKMRMTTIAASPTVNEKQINNICSRTKHSGLCSSFCWTPAWIPLASSNEHLNWLPWMPFYFTMHKSGMTVDYLWSLLSSLYFSVFSSFPTVIMYKFYTFYD